MDGTIYNHEINIDIPEDNVTSLLSSLVDSGEAQQSRLGKRVDVQDTAQPMKLLDSIFKDSPIFSDLEKRYFSQSTDLSSSSFCSCFSASNQQRLQQQHKQRLQCQHSFGKQLDDIDLQLIHTQPSTTEPQHANEKSLSLYGDNNGMPFEGDTLRFIYYHSDTGRLRGNTLFDLCVSNGTTDLAFEDLLNKENYWLDITCPSLTELHAIGQVFGIHPLTIEDIANQEVREKCDSFRNYLFVSYRAFIHDSQVLKPVSFYNVVFKQHLLTIHFGTVPHIDHVQARVEQLREYITAIPEWINYAIVDQVTDSFAPLIYQIEHEVESLDNIVLRTASSTPTEQIEIVNRIGFCRKRVMQMLRLLSSKSDVIRALIKRFEERNGSTLLLPDRNRQRQQHDDYFTVNIDRPTDSFSTNTPSTIKSPLMSPSIASLHQDLCGSIHHPKKGVYSHSAEDNGQIFPDVGLYLGDVQDHILSMLQNLNHYETLLARTHANYLAKISIELSKTSNLTNLVIGRLTIFATIIVPMNLVTGIWGMNVKVPGGDFDNLSYFFWIISCLVAFAVLSLTLARRWRLL